MLNVLSEDEDNLIMTVHIIPDKNGEDLKKTKYKLYNTITIKSFQFFKYNNEEQQNQAIY